MLDEKDVKELKKLPLEELRRKLVDAEAALKNRREEQQQAVGERAIDAAEFASAQAKLLVNTISDIIADKAEEIQDELLDDKREQLKNDVYNIITRDKEDKASRYYGLIRHPEKYIVIEDLADDDPNELNLNTLPSVDFSGMISYLNDDMGIPEYFDILREKDLRGVFDRADLIKSKITSSYDRKRWNPDRCFNIRDIIDKYQIELPDPETVERDENGKVKHDEMANDWIYCLGGGRKENIDHLKQWVPNGLLYPERNFLGPHLVIVGQPGENGKGILIEAMKTIHTSISVNMASVHSHNTGFNGGVENSILNIYDDQSPLKFDQAKLKAEMGNPTLIVMYKGANQFTADNNNRTIILSNDHVWRVSGIIDRFGKKRSVGEDRRISYITTNVVFPEYLANKHGVSVKEGRAMATAFVKRVIKNREEFGKVLLAWIEEFNMADEGYVLEPLHGKDYWDRVQGDGDAIGDALETLVPVFLEQRVMPYPALKRAVEALTGIEWKKDTRTLGDAWTGLLNRHGIEVSHWGKREYITFTHHTAPDVKHQCVGWILAEDEADWKREFNWGRLSRAGYNKSIGIMPDELEIYDYDSEEEDEEPAEQVSKSGESDDMFAKYGKLKNKLD